MNKFFRKESHPAHVILWNTNVAMRNALSPSYYEGLIEGLGMASNDPDVAAVILAGEGGFFCSGGDLNLLKERRAMSLEERHTNINRLHDIIRAIRNCRKPVIAAVEGGAAGAGLSIAMTCDMIVAARGAKFTLSYVRAGLVPDGGATYALTQALPRATVTRMAMLAEPLLAERMYELGAVTELTPSGAALEGAQALAGQLAQGPEGAIASIKDLLNSAETNTFPQQLDAECHAMAHALGQDEAQTGISAFLNKKLPVFR